MKTLRLLFIKTSSLGDIVQVFPVVNILQQLKQPYTLDWVVEKPFAELVEAHPGVNRVFTIDTKKWRGDWHSISIWKEIQKSLKRLREEEYDFILDFQGNTKSGIVMGCARGKKKIGFAREFVAEWPNLLFSQKKIAPPKGRSRREEYLHLCEEALNIRSSADSFVRLILNEAEKKTLEKVLLQPAFTEPLRFLICPGSQWFNKQLSTEQWKKWIEYLNQHIKAEFIFLWGTPFEAKMVEEIAKVSPKNTLVLEKYSLPFVQNLMFHVHAIVAMDSLALHLGGSTSVPTYGYFGPSVGEMYKPFGPFHEVFQGACPYKETFVKRCRYMRSCPTGACLKDMLPEKLASKFLEWWINRGSQSLL